jgi:hypothetical protein
MTTDPRQAQAEAMTTDELRTAARRLGVNPRGGLSKATRRDLINWYVMNTPRKTEEN